MRGALSLSLSFARSRSRLSRLLRSPDGGEKSSKHTPGDAITIPRRTSSSRLLHFSFFRSIRHFTKGAVTPGSDGNDGDEEEAAQNAEARFNATALKTSQHGAARRIEAPGRL